MADDRGEPGCESRRFDSYHNDMTKTFGWFTFGFHFSSVMYLQIN